MGRSEKRLPGFTSHKTEKPIQYRARWMRAALILTTLDHEVLSLEPGTPDDVPIGGHVVLLVQSKWGRSRILLADDPSLVAPPDAQIQRKCDLMKRPFASDCEAIWAHRAFRVGAVQCIAIHAALAEGSWTQIGHLQRLLRRTDSDMSNIFTLIAQGRIEIDIGSGLSPTSWVRMRQAQSDRGGPSACINASLRRPIGL